MIHCTKCNGVSISDLIWVRTNEPMYVKKSGIATDKFKQSTYKDEYYPIDHAMQDKVAEDTYFCHNCNDVVAVEDKGDA